MMQFSETRVKTILLAVAFGLMVWGFQTLLFSHAPMVFNDAFEDMSFGWYVPVFSLYVVWSEREKILASAGRSSWVGLFLALPFLFLGVLGVRGVQVRFEIVAFAGLLVTVPWAFFGRAMAKRLVFPAGFLLFCIPLATYLDVVTVHLRLFATGTAYAILRGFGAGIVRVGTMLAAADGSFSIDVAEPCSGLRSIFALTALTTGYAYFNQPTWLRRAVLFACAVPLAVFGNVMRILTICLVGRFASADFATGFYHDYSGFVVFIAAILLMVLCGELVTQVAERCRKPVSKRGAADGGDAIPAPAASGGRSAFAVPVLTLAVLAFSGWSLTHVPETVVCEPPEVALGEIPGFTSERLEVSEAELRTLPADTRFDKRLYTSADGGWYAVSVVIGGQSKSSIHRPELCLPSQGFLMADPRTVEVDGVSWRLIRLDGGAGRSSQGFAYTFFNQLGYRTSSHFDRILRDIWDRSFHNRIDRWVMVTVNASRADPRALEDFLRRLKGVLK